MVELAEVSRGRSTNPLEDWEGPNGVQNQKLSRKQRRTEIPQEGLPVGSRDGILRYGRVSSMLRRQTERAPLVEDAPV